MSAAGAETRALVDLGLLTRVACHELNNLIANQRGYSRLLLQRGAASDASQRWLNELVSAGEGLHELVGRLQHWSRQPTPPERQDSPAWAWPPAPALRDLAARLRSQGCPLAEVALQRLLGIVAGLAAARPEDWRELPHGLPPAHGALLGAGDGQHAMLGLQLPDRSGERETLAWNAAADLILPSGDADGDTWLRALALGLLRQCGGDLCFAAGQEQRISIYLPIAGAELENR